MAGRNPLHLFRASRAGLRTSQWAPMRQQFGRRRVQTVAETNVEPPKNESAFTKLWNSEVGPKTVHFWAPIMKWGLVLAGIADLARPAENLSLQQNGALVATGAIWTRWCFVIRPKNYFLATVNFFVFLVGTTQCTRIFLYNQSIKNSSLTDELKKAAKDEKEMVKGIVESPERAAEKAKAAA
ncbi:UPF0041-domain-containing protein [Viridothelium virens]|uniref:Mitochondrial pyruvate carrier n=1 Tax=Viridothelium virens TaxID=1048519 RepID=A0A6A6HK68_VIRVR|nr:UPF0041-domain-containing protein [Viridothelium virens]